MIRTGHYNRLSYSHATENGVYLTDVESGQCRLLASFADMRGACMTAERYAEGDFYGFSELGGVSSEGQLIIPCWSFRQWCFSRINPLVPHS